MFRFRDRLILFLPLFINIVYVKPLFQYNGPTDSVIKYTIYLCCFNLNPTVKSPFKTSRLTCMKIKHVNITIQCNTVRATKSRAFILLINN